MFPYDVVLSALCTVVNIAMKNGVHSRCDSHFWSRASSAIARMNNIGNSVSHSLVMMRVDTHEFTLLARWYHGPTSHVYSHTAIGTSFGKDSTPPIPAFLRSLAWALMILGIVSVR